MRLSEERIKRAILWGLKIPFWISAGSKSEGDRTKEQVRNDWELIRSWMRKDKAHSKQLAELLVDPLKEIIEWALTGSQEVSKARPAIPAQWSGLNEYLRKQGELPKMMAHKAARLLE